MTLSQSLTAQTPAPADLLAAMPGFVYRRRVTAEGVVDFTYFSASIMNLLGLEAMPRDCAHLRSFIHPADVARYRDALRVSAETETVSDITYRVIDAFGREHRIRDIARPHVDADGAVIWEGMALDLTPEDALSALGTPTDCDPATGLADREALLRGAAANLETGDVGPLRPTMLHVSVADWSAVNSSLGATRRNALLRAIGRRLSAFVGQDADAARTDVSEFTLFASLPETDVAAVVSLLSDEMSRPFKVHGRDLQLTGRIKVGMLLPGEDGDLPADERARRLLALARAGSESVHAFGDCG